MSRRSRYIAVGFALVLTGLVACGSKKETRLPPPPPVSQTGKTGFNEVNRTANHVARMRLPYVFGGDCPSDGGMDCSGSIQYVLKQSGLRNVPRTSYAQYEWVKEHSRLKRGKEIQASKLKKGDLIFWGGTYDSGHKVSHVMLYLGERNDGNLYMFGGRSKRIRGIHGGGVDIHKLRKGKHDNLIGYGRIPGLR